jgi:hypothetical protein
MNKPAGVYHAGTARMATTAVLLLPLLSLLSLLSLLGIAACGDDRPDADGGEERTPRDEAPALDPGAGVLFLGGDTIPFRVASCDSSAASAGSDDEVLSAASAASAASTVHLLLDGVASLPDGRSLQITVLRVNTDTTTWHSVGLDYGTEYWEARRGRARHSDGAKEWREFTDSAEPVSSPLFTIDDGAIRAEGRFSSAEGSSSEPRDGRLTAVCPQ